MPRWILSAPRESCPASEQRTAELLGNLGPDYTVRWGFSYQLRGGVWREGDFIIQGPNGHLLVLEAKSGPAELDPVTGRWSTADGENPFLQLDAEWSGVLGEVLEFADAGRFSPPFVQQALALPDVTVSPDVPSYQGQPRARILDSRELGNLGDWWQRHLGTRPLQCSVAQARNLFNTLYATGVPGTATRHVLDFSQQVLERHTRGRYEILDALEENHQLLVAGGPGTGKTWLALEQARRWAAGGKSVLFLCYNLELEVYLRAACTRFPGTITVRSYESLARELLGGDLPIDGLSGADKAAFFDVELPSLLREAVAAAGFTPRHDALVVDEAQDHNTGDGAADPGWWRIYWRLLRQGGEAPVAIFHDPSQRLFLRAGRFDPEVIRNQLLQPVLVRLRHPVRYTRQLRRYLAGLGCPATEELLRDFHGHHLLPEGPEPEILEPVRPEDQGAACARLVQGWLHRELAKAQDIAVLFPSQQAIPAWANTRIHGVAFTTDPASANPAAIRCLSIHRAKGLERRAIVLAGLPPWAGCRDNEYLAHTYVMGATRAQQLLAVVPKPPTPA
jgi:hypothetical protein